MINARVRPKTMPMASEKDEAKSVWSLKRKDAKYFCSKNNVPRLVRTKIATMITRLISMVDVVTWLNDENFAPTVWLGQIPQSE